MTIETGGKKYPVHFGMNAWATFGDLTGFSMNKVSDVLSDLGALKPGELLKLFYAGFIEGARKEGTECLIGSVEEVGDLYDSDSAFLTKLLATFSEQSPPSEEGGDKKK